MLDAAVEIVDGDEAETGEDEIVADWREAETQLDESTAGEQPEYPRPKIPPALGLNLK